MDITDFKGGENSFTITPQGAGKYEYSIDGINYQTENTFTSLETGEYFIYIRDINGCSPVYRKRVYVLDYPKFFTPNGDGKNETWRIPYLSSRPGANVIIYDRFGKLITSFYGNAPGWDGTLNGYRLPATDYWFVINLENGRVIRGHFALIR
ncbi:T9SS type B sorting domain-containing protein [Flavobacterium psychrotrophum]|uniref:T9SS type B sorting domain-containing protein n=1 Tax=Flavobacterium psychrotrophum TaxID=2294119 RepID=UPI0013C45448|nr:T9SS type B sorting domain-containing protein [Flavobacterium psychrotrophum]